MNLMLDLNCTCLCQITMETNNTIGETDDLIHSFRVLYDTSRNDKELITENHLLMQKINFKEIFAKQLVKKRLSNT